MKDALRQEGRLTWKAVHALWIAALVASLLSAAYGAIAGGPQGSFLAFLASVLGYTVGGLFGFLFGFPRYSDSAPVASSEDLRSSERRWRGLTPNTNLERIVDWLMTMIVGATLVNLQAFVKWLGYRFSEIGASISPEGQAVHGVLLVGPFAIAGFLHLYLWARRFLPAEWNDADKAFERLEQLEEKTKQLGQSLNLVQDEVFKVEGEKVQELARHLRSSGVDETVIGEIVRRIGLASKWEDDPYVGFAPNASDGFVLEARLSPKSEDSDSDCPYVAELKVRREDNAAFSAFVAFLLHNSYDTPYLSKDVEKDIEARVGVESTEASVVAAVVVPKGKVPSKTIMLAVDMNELPGLPDNYRHQ